MTTARLCSVCVPSSCQATETAEDVRERVHLLGPLGPHYTEGTHGQPSSSRQGSEVEVTGAYNYNSSIPIAEWTGLRAAAWMQAIRSASLVC